MDLQEFSSQGPKPWLVISNANVISTDTNATSVTPSAILTSNVLTNITPAGLQGNGWTIPVESCLPGMAYRLSAYVNVANSPVIDHVYFYLAQDAAGAIALSPNDFFQFGLLAATTMRKIEIDLTFVAVGSAGEASVIGWRQDCSQTGVTTVIGAINNTTVDTTNGLNLRLFFRWVTGGQGQFTLLSTTLERLR